MDLSVIAEQLDLVEGGRWSTPYRLTTLGRLAAVYEIAPNRVMGQGWGCALDRCCPDAKHCWAGMEDTVHPGRAEIWDDREEDGSIFWPWVGEQYRSGGVCLVGITPNMDDNAWWSIALEYGITGHVINAFDSGLERVSQFARSPFHYRAATTAAAVLDWLEGRPPPLGLRQPKTLASVVEKISRLQAVKCIPRTDRGKTTDAMCERCPERFLLRELEVLEPGVIVALGKQPREALARTGRLDLSVEKPAFRCGALKLAARTIDCFALPHPSARPPADWEAGYAGLVRYLRRRSDKALLATRRGW